MNVLLDTNIWVSGLLWGGTPGKVLQLASTQQITVYVSLAQFDELSRTLNKPKLQPRLQKLGVTADTVMQAIRELSQPLADAPVEVAIANLRDPNDAFLLNVAIAANVECLVSGDDDLLRLADNFPNPILTASEFLERFFPIVFDASNFEPGTSGSLIDCSVSGSLRSPTAFTLIFSLTRYSIV